MVLLSRVYRALQLKEPWTTDPWCWYTQTGILIEVLTILTLSLRLRLSNFRFVYDEIYVLSARDLLNINFITVQFV